MEELKSINFVFSIVILVFTQPVFSGISSETSSVRSLTVGDTFTPGEMLPVAKRLMEKVPEPGMGKGIVSASKNTEDLADRLFEAFFLTSERYVKLTDFDISGLDALQALALSGEVANNSTIKSFTDAPAAMKEIFQRGQLIKVDNEGRRCKYKLLAKRLNRFNVKRRGIALAKKLSKKRRLVVKSRKNLKEHKNKVLTIEKTGGIMKEPLCRWSYECKNPGDLDSCQLHTQCVHNATMTTEYHIGVSEKLDPKKDDAQHLFRKMLGSAAVDEEVGKILKTRIIYLTPSNMGEDDRVESLGEYFNKIIMAQSVGEFTTPAITVTKDYGKIQSKGSNEPTESVIKDENLQIIDSNVYYGRTVRKMYNTKRKF